MTADLCILTPDPGYEENVTGIVAEYRALFGDQLALRTWNDPGDLSGFRLILPLLAWGYQRDAARWFRSLDAWEAEALPFANSIAILRWNTDKDYLLDLEERGIAIVPTVETHDLCAQDLADARSRFGCDILVVKPSISGGADGTYRLGPGDAIPFDVLEREMLIQPLMPAIANEGEYSLFHFNGQFSHAILKTPAAGDFRVQDQFGGQEQTVDTPAAARTLAEATLAALPEVPLYARVDMVRGDAGGFCLMEVELIEPALFLGHTADGGAAFAASVIGRL